MTSFLYLCLLDNIPYVCTVYTVQHCIVSGFSIKYMPSSRVKNPQIMSGYIFIPILIVICAMRSKWSKFMVLPIKYSNNSFFCLNKLSHKQPTDIFPNPLVHVVVLRINFRVTSLNALIRQFLKFVCLKVVCAKPAQASC